MRTVPDKRNCPIYGVGRFDSLFLDGKANQEAQNPSKYLLYQDPMAGIFDQEVVMSGVDTGAYVLDGMI